MYDNNNNNNTAIMILMIITGILLNLITHMLIMLLVIGGTPVPTSRRTAFENIASAIAFATYCKGMFTKHLTESFAVAYLQELINYDFVSEDAGTPFLGTPFLELKVR